MFFPIAVLDDGEGLEEVWCVLKRGTGGSMYTRGPWDDYYEFGISPHFHVKYQDLKKRVGIDVM